MTRPSWQEMALLLGLAVMAGYIVQHDIVRVQLPATSAASIDFSS